MKPCAAPLCPALATRGDYCPVHSGGLLTFRPAPDYVAEQEVSAEDRAAAIAQRERIARLYRRDQ